MVLHSAIGAIKVFAMLFREGLPKKKSASLGQPRMLIETRGDKNSRYYFFAASNSSRLSCAEVKPSWNPISMIFSMSALLL